MFLFLLVSVLINIILREGDVTYKRVIISTYCKLYLVYAYLSKQAHYANTDRVHTRGVQELDAIESSTINRTSYQFLIQNYLGLEIQNFT